MSNVESRERPNLLKRTASALLLGISTIVHPAAALPSSAHQEGEDTPTTEVAEDQREEAESDIQIPEEELATEEPQEPEAVVEEAPVIIIPRPTPTIGPEKPPVFLEKFGNIETERVEFVNKGKTAYVAQGDPTLYQNMLWIRDNYAKYPDIKRRIYFYDDIEQLRSIFTLPYPANTGILNYPRRYFEYGEWRWQVLPDGVIEFHMSLPKPVGDVPQAWIDGGKTEVVSSVLTFLFSGPDGKSAGGDKFGMPGWRAIDRRTEEGKQKEKDLAEHPVVISDDSTKFIVTSALRVVRKA